MFRKTNICRAITFCSNYIPANAKAQNWEYVSIGTIDGIVVSDNLIKKPDDSITLCIWEGQKDFQQRLQGEFTTQQIFIIRYDDIETEQKFWSMEKAYPFYFFAFVRSQMAKKYYGTIRSDNMSQNMTREELVDLVETIITMRDKNTNKLLSEEEHIALVVKFKTNIKHPGGTDLIFYPELVGLSSEPTVDEIADL